VLPAAASDACAHADDRRSAAAIRPAPHHWQSQGPEEAVDRGDDDSPDRSLPWNDFSAAMIRQAVRRSTQYAAVRPQNRRSS